jgi:hypothetical protein
LVVEGFRSPVKVNEDLEGLQTARERSERELREKLADASQSKPRLSR